MHQEEAQGISSEDFSDGLNDQLPGMDLSLNRGKNFEKLDRITKSSVNFVFREKLSVTC